jgi:hypothetical protein
MGLCREPEERLMPAGYRDSDGSAPGAENVAAARAARKAAHQARIWEYMALGLYRRTAAEAAGRLGVSRRAIQRYRAILRQEGRLP